MGNQYYLMSQLPDITAVSIKQPLPVTEEYFRNLCARFLDESALRILNALSLIPPRISVSTGSVFVDAWYERERALRLALAQVRALNLHRESEPLTGACTGDVLQAARTAVGMENPLAAEQFLYQYRLETIGILEPVDMFSEDAVYAYALRLLLGWRIRLFNEETGMASYHTIYEKILGETT